MTPTEKAQELFSEYRFILSLPNAPLGDNKDNVAKQCALKAIDEINKNEMFETPYWEEVKLELEKL